MMLCLSVVDTCVVFCGWFSELWWGCDETCRPFGLCEIYRLLENVWFAWAHDVMARSCVLCEKMILRLQHVALCVRGTRKHKNAVMERLNLASFPAILQQRSRAQ